MRKSGKVAKYFEGGIWKCTHFNNALPLVGLEFRDGRYPRFSFWYVAKQYHVKCPDTITFKGLLGSLWFLPLKWVNADLTEYLKAITLLLNKLPQAFVFVFILKLQLWNMFNSLAKFNYIICLFKLQTCQLNIWAYQILNFKQCWMHCASLYEVERTGGRRSSSYTQILPNTVFTLA